MNKKIPILIFLLFSFFHKAQTLKFSGNINDTANNSGVPNVLLMALKFNDSSLVNYTRSNSQGVFKSIHVPVDTYLVILSHPNFSDKTYLLVPSANDSVYNFKNVVLPPKSFEFNEVEIVAPKEKTYYKGDTLIFTADSFKTAPNATVEDLLKKLPGMRVDANGKITVQGKEVDQVLVDGDEFFGSDPTIATRNLNASSVKDVQVFEKKNENTEEGASETLKVLNLKLKDDAKKGYFGKVSGASDFQKFYEGELLANNFKGNRKVSVFGLVANTPKQAFGGGEQPWSYDEESGTWTSNNNRGTGIPLTIKSGFYFNDKIGKNTKINTDYTFNQNRLLTGSETNTQFFLQDTNYTNTKIKASESISQSHSFNFRIVQKLDSLTELTVAPKLKYNLSNNTSEQSDDFISEENITTRRTFIKNVSRTENTDANIFLKVSRNFMKKDRNLTVTYQPVYSSNTGTTKLNTDFTYYNGQSADSSLAQQRIQNNSKMEHNASLIYVEPFTKKFKTELSYNFTNNQNTNDRETFNYRASGYDLLDSALSNNFENKRLIHRAGTKLIYDVKKYRIVVGSYFRNIQQENLNVTTDTTLKLNVNNILPIASFQYRISQGSNFSLNYTSSSQQPDLLQMQPVRDNTDPNRISLGNPDLKPTFSNNVTLNYYFYKGVSDRNLWAGGNYMNTNNQISYATTYDSQGRAITQPININGNYNTNLWFGGGFPIFKKFLKVYYNFNGSFSNNVSFVNGTKNIAQTTSFRPGLNLEKNAEKFNVGIGGNYSYNVPKSNISVQSNQPYYSYSFEGNVTIKITKKFILSTDGTYTDNGNRTPGYNLNYFIWNASLSHLFLKTENLVLSINANDILNQNINNQRYITSNQIVDTKTQIIKRYFLLKLLYKFNNQKTKVEDNDY
jgi:hypothetical protein